ncbi:MAG TPA: hypothetical protein VMT20_11965 [Terriglobia bacterium]|nr:hypothetical protein [Terriglobia bacterium]
MARQALALLFVSLSLATFVPLTARPLAAPHRRILSAQDAGADASQASTASARMTYTRTLAGSSPEYLAVSVNADGSGSYVGRHLNEPDHPRALRLSPATTERLFALAAQLRYFKSVDLDSHKKVANLGRKTLTYENGDEKNQVEFNFTQDRAGRDLVDLFEGVANVEEQIDLLEYAIKYDPLSLPQDLLAIQIALNHNELVDPQLMVPSLQEICSNSRFMHVAQTRAQDILNRVSPTQ